jgi:hypothetical protein
MVSYQMSYTQEWKTGLAQKRIDVLIELIPELLEGKTFHIDAFLGARPLDREAPISPWLGYQGRRVSHSTQDLPLPRHRRHLRMG